jgi:hypothetical protein
MTTATNNGTQRKQLSDQLDRLDGILDGLAEALNGAVADAVRDVIGQAVRQAVHAAVTEVLASPDLLRAALERHAPASAPPAPPLTRPEPPTPKENATRIAGGLRAKAVRAAGSAGDRLRGACAAALEAGKKVARIAANAPAICKAVARAAWASRKPCAVAVGVGVACGAACYLGGLLFSSMAGGAGGAAITLSALTLPLKRLFWGGDR